MNYAASYQDCVDDYVSITDRYPDIESAIKRIEADGDATHAAINDHADKDQLIGVVMEIASAKQLLDRLAGEGIALSHDELKQLRAAVEAAELARVIVSDAITQAAENEVLP